MSRIKWLPLESNPEVMNKCLRNLGVPEHFSLWDIYSLDDEFMDTIPQPSLAVLLLFPISAKYEEYCAAQEELMRTKAPDTKDIYFMKQTIHNACGTIAILHALANNERYLNLPEGSVLKIFLDETRHMPPEEKGKYLEDNMEISALHEEIAQEGQTEAPSLEDEVNLHFVALVEVGGKLVELDGRKSMPIVHCDTDNFLKDALHIIQDYTKRDPDNMNFTAMTFSAENVTLEN